MIRMPTEPWLSGALTDVDPYLAPVLYSFEMARQDLAVCTEGLTAAQIWARPGGAASIGFHIRHIGGSTDRLLTYAERRQLDASQMAEAQAEAREGASREELLVELGSRLAAAETRVRALDPERFREARSVGRKQLPTTLIGLVVHIAEHTQRHTGQAVTTAKFVRAQ